MKNTFYAFLSRVFIRISNFFAECGDWCLDKMDQPSEVYMVGPYAEMMNNYNPDVISGIRKGTIVSFHVSPSVGLNYKGTTKTTNKKEPK